MKHKDIKKEEPPHAKKRAGVITSDDIKDVSDIVTPDDESGVGYASGGTLDC